MTTEPQGTVTMTRAKLYKQVWAKPAVHLAKELGISDVAIGKICKKYEIPKPPLGYWAKAAHDHKVNSFFSLSRVKGFSFAIVAHPCQESQR